MEMSEEDKMDEESAEEEELSEPKEESIQESEYTMLERNYQTAVNEFDGSEELQKYGQPFTMLFEAYARAHSQEDYLREQIQKAQSEIAYLNSKADSAAAQRAEDTETIENLRKEILTAQKLIDAAHAREQNAQETIGTLRNQLAQLNKEVEQKKRMEMDQSDEFGPAAKNREGLLREREKLLAEIVSLRQTVAGSNSTIEQLQTKVSEHETKIDELTQEVEALTSDAAREQRIKDHMDQDIKDLTEQIQSKEETISSLNLQIQNNVLAISKLELTISDQTQMAERMTREAEVLTTRLQKAQQDNENQVITLEKLVHDNGKKTSELKAKDEEMSKVRNELLRSTKVQDALTKRVQFLEQQRSVAEHEREHAKEVLIVNEREVEQLKKQANVDKRNMENMTREKEILKNNMVKTTATMTEQHKILKLAEQNKRSLEIKIENCMDEISKLRKNIGSLERERERLHGEGIMMEQKIQDALEDGRLKQATIFDFKKQISESEKKFRVQQSLFETLRSERNHLSENLQESQDEISELKHKLKVMGHQIEQLKEDISTKETQLLKEESALQKLEKERENLRAELQQSRDDVTDCKHQITALKRDQRHLLKVIQEADSEHLRQEKIMEQIINERDILGTQLVRRNDERALLYDKINLLQTTLHKGEVQYEQRLDDIRLLKIEIRKLRQEKNLLSRNVSIMSDLRQEVLHLQRDLTQEKLKCRALEEELQRPLNVHRWRKLEGTDPEMFELILKVQFLQKRLIIESSEAIKHNQKLRLTERLYLDLQKSFDRKPGPEILEKLHSVQKSLETRDRKLKCLLVEVNMYKSQADQCKTDMIKLNEQLISFKKKYFQLKRLGSKTRSEDNKDAPLILPSLNTNQQRFTGGGFNLNVQPGRNQKS